MEETKVEVEVCEHCGQELKKASEERQAIRDTQLKNITKVSDALSERQDKLDVASQEALEIIQRIEKKVGADAQTLADIKELEARVRAKAKVLQEREDLANN